MIQLDRDVLSYRYVHWFASLWKISQEKKKKKKPCRTPHEVKRIHRESERLSYIEMSLVNSLRPMQFIHK